MKSLVVLCLVFSSLSLFASIDRKLADGKLAYYGAEFYTKKVTKDSLYKILDEHHAVVPNKPDVIANNCQTQNQTECYRHTSVGYDKARQILFGELYGTKTANGYYVTDVYCGKKVQYKQVSDISNMGSIVNIEHTWPQSRFNGNFDKNTQKSDMHHLFPTDSDANNRRANHEFGDIGNNHDELNVQNCSNSGLADISGHFIFTPPKGHRGNVARALFYFATRYKLFIKPAEEMILRQWHKMDPVDDAERARHEIIAKYQKIRNPFVDYPELTEKISDL